MQEGCSEAGHVGPGVTLEDASDRVRWRKIICCDNHSREQPEEAEKVELHL